MPNANLKGESPSTQAQRWRLGLRTDYAWGHVYDIEADFGGVYDVIATVHCDEGDESNLNLILSAPALREINAELVEALERICNMQERHFGDATITHLQLARLCEEAKAALAKARGTTDE